MEDCDEAKEDTLWLKTIVTTDTNSYQPNYSMSVFQLKIQLLWKEFYLSVQKQIIILQD